MPRSRRRPCARESFVPVTPDKVAAAVVWLCSPSVSFVVGLAVPVDGGFNAN